MADSRQITVHSTEPTCVADITLNDDGSASMHVYRTTPLSSYNSFGGTFVVTLTDNQGHSISVTKPSTDKTTTDFGTATAPAGTFSTSGTVTYTVSSSCSACTYEGSDHYNHGESYSVNWHTHSAPSGCDFWIRDVTSTSMRIGWTGISFSWGCTTDGTTWHYRYRKQGDGWGANDGWHDGPFENEVTISGLEPGYTYDVEVLYRNGHYSAETASSTQTIVSKTQRVSYAAPVVSISNYVPYNSNQGVSGYTNAIHVSASNSASNTGSLSWDFRINGGAYQSNGLFQGLNSGTTYTLEARATNPDGVSNSASMVIRTKYAESNIGRSITINDIGLEHATFTVSLYPNSTASCTFKVTNSSGAQITSGSFAVGTAKSTGYVFEPSTQYTITATIKMSSTYDDITVTASKSFTTDAKNSLSKALGNIEFELPGVNAGTYTINSPSGNKSKVVFLVTNQSSESVTINTKNDQAAGAFNFSLNDTEWDNTYKALSNAAKNSLSYTMKIYTYSNKNSGYPENSKFISTYTGTVTLTGKKKTGHLGVNNSPKRTCSFIGVDNKPRRAVVWVGTNNGPRRCI